MAKPSQSTHTRDRGREKGGSSGLKKNETKGPIWNDHCRRGGMDSRNRSKDGGLSRRRIEISANLLYQYVEKRGRKISCR